MATQDPAFHGSVEDLQLGFGYNAGRHEPAGSSLVAQSSNGSATAPIIVQSTGVGTTSATISIVTSTSDLDVVVSASAKGSYNGGDYDVNAAASFSNAFDFSTTTLNYLVAVQVESGDLQIDNAVLSSLASQTLYNANNSPGINALGPFNVYRTFGDSYVSTVKRGVYLYAQIEIMFQSMSDKLQAQQEIGFSSLGTKFDANSSQSVSKTLSKEKVTINVYSVGYKVAALPQTLTDLLNLASAVADTDVASNGTVVDYGLDLITSLGDYAETSLASQDTDLGTLINNGLQYLSIVDSLSDMIANPRNYAKCPTQLNLQTLLSLGKTNFQSISEIAQSYTKPGSVSSATYETVEQFMMQLRGAKLPQPYSNLTDVSQPIAVTFSEVTQFISVANHLAGGDDMDGKPTTVTASATYTIQPAIANQAASQQNPPTQILGTGTFDFKSESKCEVNGAWSWLLYTAPPGLYIVTSGAIPSSSVQTLVEKTTHSYVTIPLAGNTSGSVPTLASADCLLDTAGADIGKLFATNLTFNPVYIQYGHIEDYNPS